MEILPKCSKRYTLGVESADSFGRCGFDSHLGHYRSSSKVIQEGYADSLGSGNPRAGLGLFRSINGVTEQTSWLVTGVAAQLW